MAWGTTLPHGCQGEGPLQVLASCHSPVCGADTCVTPSPTTAMQAPQRAQAQGALHDDTSPARLEACRRPRRGRAGRPLRQPAATTQPAAAGAVVDPSCGCRCSLAQHGPVCNLDTTTTRRTGTLTVTLWQAGCCCLCWGSRFGLRLRLSLQLSFRPAARTTGRGDCPHDAQRQGGGPCVHGGGALGAERAV